VRGLTENGSLRRIAEIGAARAAAACPGTAAVDLGLHGPGAGGAVKFRPVGSPAAGPTPGATDEELVGLLDDAGRYVRRALHALVEVTGAAGNVERATADFRAGLEAALRLPGLGENQLTAGLADDWTWIALIGRLVSRALSAVAEPDGGTGKAIDDLALGRVIAGIFGDLGLDEGAAWRLVALLRMLRRLPVPSSVAKLAAAERAPALVRALVADESVRPYIRVNVWEGVSWFNRESFNQVLWWMAALDTLDAAGAAAVGAGARAAAAKAGARGVAGAARKASRVAAARKPAPASKGRKAAGKAPAGAARMPAAAARAPGVAPDITQRLRAAERLTATLAKAAKACGYQLDDLESAARG
jgi:hypothetical protein